MSSLVFLNTFKNNLLSSSVFFGGDKDSAFDGSGSWRFIYYGLDFKYFLKIIFCINAGKF